MGFAVGPEYSNAISCSVLTDNKFYGNYGRKRRSLPRKLDQNKIWLNLPRMD